MSKLEPTDRRPADRPKRRAALRMATAISAAILLQGLVWWLLVHYFKTRRIWYGFFDVSDVSLYEDYARRLARGLHLYTNVPFEYPPLAAPLMTLPRRLGDDYAWAFARAMMVLCAVAAAFATATAVRLSRGYARPLAAAFAFALVTLLAGPIVANRFDIAVGLDVAVFAYCMARRWWSAAAASLGLGFALKLAPAILLPLVLVLAVKPWRALRAALAFAVAAVLPFIPHLLRSPRAWLYFVRYHAGRPLGIESLSATPYLLRHALTGHTVVIGDSHGSQCLIAPGSQTLASLLLWVMAACIGGLYLLIWQRRQSLRRAPAELASVACGLVMTFVCANKVFSPQFLMWTFPLVALLASDPRTSRRVLAGLLVSAALLTQLEFPSRYWDLVALRATPIYLVAARNSVLLASAVVAVVLLWRVPRRVSR